MKYKYEEKNLLLEINNLIKNDDYVIFNDM
jgi:hypothetical protein